MSLPLLNTFGVFTVLSPFTIGTVNYRVVAINRLSLLVESGVDVFDLYYAPYNLTQQQFLADVNAGVALITLESVDGPTVYIPSTYISSTPVNVAVPYSRLVLSVDLGELPESLSLASLQSQIKDIVDSLVGVDSAIQTHKVPILKNYSKAESLVKEAQRQLLIEKRPTFYSAKVAAEALLQEANEKIQLLEAALIAASTAAP